MIHRACRTRTTLQSKPNREILALRGNIFNNKYYEWSVTVRIFSPIMWLSLFTPTLVNRDHPILKDIQHGLKIFLLSTSSHHGWRYFSTCNNLYDLSCCKRDNTKTLKTVPPQSTVLNGYGQAQIIFKNITWHISICSRFAMHLFQCKRAHFQFPFVHHWSHSRWLARVDAI